MSETDSVDLCFRWSIFTERAPDTFCAPVFSGVVMNPYGRRPRRGDDDGRHGTTGVVSFRQPVSILTGGQIGRFADQQQQF